jgi:hypothetical protein
MFRYKLRTLLMVLALGPPLLGFFYWFVVLGNWNPTVVNGRMMERNEERNRRELDQMWKSVEKDAR